jgi:hypothetical protein
MQAIRNVAWILGLGVSVTLWALPAHAYLTYTLPAALKQPDCTGDTDGDCLDNRAEWALAWIVAPHYFYDEDEDCSGRNNRTHYSRQDFYQVRPEGVGIQEWSPADGQRKWVSLTYFLLHPHDCQSRFGVGGHQGDSEHVRYWLYSFDLRTWYLFNGRYWHHGRSHDFSGIYLEARATEIGSRYASIAADEDGHGSWAGRSGNSSHCAGGEDDFCFSTCDCFVGTMRSAFLNGDWEWVGTTRNIGGPAPETWNAAVLQVSGHEAYSIVDVAHGTSNREYWTPKAPYYQQFCGWECPSRNSDGTCNVSAHGETGCSSPLWEKVDTTCFGLPSDSCCGACGGFQGSCGCDSACVDFGDCCADAGAVCSLGARSATTLHQPHATQAFQSPFHPPAALPTIPTAQPTTLVAQHLPSLTQQSPQEQLVFLKWLRTAPQGKIAVAFPQLLRMRHLSNPERAIRAHRHAQFLIDMGEHAGISAPDFPVDFTAAAVASEAPPPLAELPQGLLKDFNPYPEDPEARKVLEMTP